ncbi:phosphonate metabolism protein/1,5-bisphosphokinase (PRPP-forming) PhnN [Microbacterium sp. NPDC096154]|uniref:phosphonate metabolism protein/1,5-bisphosphokinase (PRPP-forming) PhnN n=1 Tax=Microbacterium sp. NPDC096154 TaxID=3155549 RepID=UPI003328F690
MGAFVGVVGPSGSGKDAAIREARARLEGCAVVFARRVITRPPGPAEDSEYASEARFARLEAAGAFVLSWRAHGLAYGIPAAAVEQVRAGAVVVGNLSRSVLALMPERFGRAFSVRVTAPDDLRRARIAARGRESAAEVAARLDRKPAPDVPVDLEIVNDGTLAAAGERLAAFLRQLARPGDPAFSGDDGASRS